MRILLVHDSATVQKLLHNYFATEVADAYVRAADSTEAANWIRSQKFDLILCGTESRRVSVQSLHGSLPGSANWDTPFVAVFSRSAPEEAERLRGLGILRHLVLPMVPEDLAALVGSLYNPRAHRADRRYALQGSSVQIDMGGVEVEAALVNVSVSGLLCDMDLPPTATEIFKAPLLAFTFPKEYGGGRVAGVRSSLLRLHVLGWNAASHPSRVRTAWKFLNVPEQAKAVLQRGLQLAQGQLEQAEAELEPV